MKKVLCQEYNIHQAVPRLREGANGIILTRLGQGGYVGRARHYNAYVSQITTRVYYTLGMLANATPGLSSIIPLLFLKKFGSQNLYISRPKSQDFLIFCEKSIMPRV